MSWQIVAGVAGGVVLAISYVPYIRDMVWGTTRPSLVSQGLWLLIGSILLVAQFVAGAPWSAVLSLSALLCNCVVVILIFRGYGYARYGWWDGACLILALVALGAWYVTANPRIAIILAIFAYVVAVAPTVMKTYSVPNSEHIGSWALVIVAAVLSILAAGTYDIANLAFPLYAFAEATLIVSLAFFGQRFARR